MTSLRIFKIYLVIYFLFASLSIYITIFTGIKVPMIIELVPLLLVFLKPFISRGLNYIDLIFSILLANSIIFFFINLEDLSWIGNIEARAIPMMAINYYIFRVLLKPEWSVQIAD